MTASTHSSETIELWLLDRGDLLGDFWFLSVFGDGSRMVVFRVWCNQRRAQSRRSFNG